MLLLCAFAAAAAQAQPALTIDPPGRTDLTTNLVNVTLTGSGFTQANGSPANGLELLFSPTGTITYTNLQAAGNTTLKATFKIASNASGTVTVTVKTANGNSQGFLWDTGVNANVCLESLQSTGCMLRWEVDATGVTGSSSQTNTSTTPNLLFNLDYQVASPKDPRVIKADPAARQSAADRFVTHLTFQTGYTQVPVANKIQPTGTSGSGSASASSASCSGTAGCTAATPQQAFVAQAGGRFGWTFGRDGHGAFTEIGGGARASFQDILPSNQVIQSGGASYVDLSSANPKNAVGLYEGTVHFRLGQIGHDTPAGTDGKYHNVSDLLVIEAGYQNNSGLQQLIASNPQIGTRNRFVGRFYAYPELPGPTHTKILVGMEYSGGIDGGPKVIQLFWGTDINPAKLFKPSGSSAPAGN